MSVSYPGDLDISFQHQLKMQHTHMRRAPEHDNHSSHLVVLACYGALCLRVCKFVSVRLCLEIITAQQKPQTKTRNMKLAETKRLWGKGQGEKETIDIYFPSFKDHGSQANERPWRKPYFPEYVWQCRGDWGTLYRLSVLGRFILHNSWNSRKFPQDWQKACLELIF